MLAGFVCYSLQLRFCRSKSRIAIIMRSIPVCVRKSRNRSSSYCTSFTVNLKVSASRYNAASAKYFKVSIASNKTTIFIDSKRIFANIENRIRTTIGIVCNYEIAIRSCNGAVSTHLKGAICGNQFTIRCYLEFFTNQKRTINISISGFKITIAVSNKSICTST